MVESVAACSLSLQSDCSWKYREAQDWNRTCKECWENTFTIWPCSERTKSIHNCYKGVRNYCLSALWSVVLFGKWNICASILVLISLWWYCLYASTSLKLLETGNSRLKIKFFKMLSRWNERIGGKYHHFRKIMTAGMFLQHFILGLIKAIYLRFILERMIDLWY